MFLAVDAKFFRGENHQVNLGGVLLSIMQCPLGVPQGPVLSPTLFNVHVNDHEDSVPDYLAKKYL